MDNIIYEHPLNERMRIFLRLEYLFKQLEHLTGNNSKWDCKNYCYTLVEIMDLLDRNDIRSEIIKELEKQIKYLISLQSSDTVNQSLLQTTIDNLNDKLFAINAKDWKLTKKLHEDELLAVIKSRAGLSNAACGFDSPVLYHWLNLPEIDRDYKIAKWQLEIRPIEECIDALLEIIRNGTMFESKKAASGYYQQDLDLLQPCQLIRIVLSSKSYPEVSADKHRISIRFFAREGIEQKPSQMRDDLEFELSCCTLF